MNKRSIVILRSQETLGNSFRRRSKCATVNDITRRQARHLFYKSRSLSWGVFRQRVIPSIFHRQNRIRHPTNRICWNFAR